jgi:hypothetical protein
VGHPTKDNMGFLKDKSSGDIAEKFALKLLEEEFPGSKFELSTGRNVGWDIAQVDKVTGSPIHTYEIKFDIKAKSTGNLCFEIGNTTKKTGKQKTGILVSEADEIWYITDGIIFKFNTIKLLQHLLYLVVEGGSDSHRLVKGGDDKRFSLILLPIKNIKPTDWCVIKEQEIS